MSSLPGKDPSLVDATSFGATGSHSRRRFLQAVGLGGVAASVPLAAGTARAESATAPEPPPQRPTSEDVALLQFAQSVELAVVHGYDVIGDRLDDGSLTPDADVTIVFRALREHHLAYTQSLAAILGRQAPGTAHPELANALAKAFATGDPTGAAADLENTAVATHGSLVGQLVGTNGAALIASIMAGEARHAATLMALSGGDAFPAAGLEDLTAALTPDPTV
jgi:hypothetical protein